jgi:hypothetical protein
MEKDDDADELLPELDFRKMPGGVRGKYAAAFRRGTNLVPPQAQRAVRTLREEARASGAERLRPPEIEALVREVRSERRRRRPS